MTVLPRMVVVPRHSRSEEPRPFAVAVPRPIQPMRIYYQIAAGQNDPLCLEDAIKKEPPHRDGTPWASQS